MSFPAMAAIVPPASKGVAQIVHDAPSKLEVMRSAWKGIHTAERTHARLIVSGRLMMTDADFEHRTNYEVCRRATGDVLIAGLGIGVILTKILAKTNVRSVTVIEKYRDVIDLVATYFPSPNLAVVEADIFEWTPSAPFDVIYFDIWPDLCTDNLNEMTKLHRRFRKRLRPNGWMDSWCRDLLLAQRRREPKRAR